MIIGKTQARACLEAVVAPGGIVAASEEMKMGGITTGYIYCPECLGWMFEVSDANGFFWYQCWDCGIRWPVYRDVATAQTL